jgi:hypothetical protein
MYNRIRRASVLLVVMWSILGDSLVHAQSFGRALSQDVRLDWVVAQEGKRSEIAGYVYNLRDGYWASNVRLQVEALDASGTVLGSNAGFVAGDVPPANRSYFEILVPVRGAASYRVTVQNLDWRTYGPQ